MFNLKNERVKQTKEVLREVLAAGYEVLYTEDSVYFHFSNGKAIGYYQTGDRLGRPREWSVTHKPSRRNGTGFGVGNMVEALKQPAFRYSTVRIEYYKDFDTFCAQYWDKKAKRIKPEV
jgi:hypothetical protein